MTGLPAGGAVTPPAEVVLPDGDGPVGQAAHIVCAVVLYREGPVRGVCGARLRGVVQRGQFVDCAVCDDVYPAHAAGCPACRQADTWGGPP